MGIRDIIEKQKRWFVPIVAAGIVVSFYSIWQSARSGELSEVVSRVYFSDDDGKTYFVEDIAKDYSFDHDGKPAYRAFVYKCASSSPFVGFLGRRTEGPKRPSPDARYATDSHSAPLEIKKPGDSKWFLFTSHEGNAIIKNLCTDGSPEAVLP